jgi:hypothetical protein
VQPPAPPEDSNAPMSMVLEIARVGALLVAARTGSLPGGYAGPGNGNAVNVGAVGEPASTSGLDAAGRKFAVPLKPGSLPRRVEVHSGGTCMPLTTQLYDPAIRRLPVVQ